MLTDKWKVLRFGPKVSLWYGYSRSPKYRSPDLARRLLNADKLVNSSCNQEIKWQVLERTVHCLKVALWLVTWQESTLCSQHFPIRTHTVFTRSEWNRLKWHDLAFLKVYRQRNRTQWPSRVLDVRLRETVRLMCAEQVVRRVRADIFSLFPASSQTKPASTVWLLNYGSYMSS